MKKILLLSVILVTTSAFAASTLTTTAEAHVSHVQKLIGALGTSRDQSSIGFSQDFTSGTSSATEEVDTLYYGQRSLGNGSSETLDLCGTLLNGLGEIVTFARVKTLYIKNTSTAQTMTVGGGSWGSWISPATAAINIPPSGAVLFVAPLAGWTVTAGTGDGLLIANETSSPAATLTYNIWIAGSSQ